MAETSSVHHKEIFIMGLTQDGKVFRPSDWAERLCGVLCQFRPPGRAVGSYYFAYSPYAKPIVIDGVKCIVIDERLVGIEPMAMKFVLNFAKDNKLQVIEACLLPDAE